MMAIDKKGIVFAGTMVLDRLKFIENWPMRSGLTYITSQSDALGGLACNCAIDMAKLAPEVPISVIGVIGEDSLGDFILNEYSKYPSIDTSMVARAGETSFTDVLTIPSGERTFLQFRGSGKLFGPEHVDFTKFDAAIMHIGYILLLDRLDSPDPEYPTGMCRVLDEARKAGIMTSVDLVSESGSRYKDIAAPAFSKNDAS